MHHLNQNIFLLLSQSCLIFNVHLQANTHFIPRFYLKGLEIFKKYSDICAKDVNVCHNIDKMHRK